MESGNFQNHPLMRLTLSLALLFLLGFWITNLALYLTKIGLSPGSVVAYYNGSEEEFLPPRTLGSMLEVTHAHLAMMALVLLLLTHLAIFSPFRTGAKQLFIWGTFGAALAEEAGGWLVRFVSPTLAPVKVIGFVSLQALLAVLIGAIIWNLWGGSWAGHLVDHPARANGSFPIEPATDRGDGEAIQPGSQSSR